MKKYALIPLVLLLVSVAAFAQTTSSSMTPNVRVSLLKYSPFPAEPGDYITLTLRVENIGTADADNVRLKLTPAYPFSLDNNSTVSVVNSATPIPVGSDMAVSLGKLPASQYTMVEYKVRIASDALEGDRQLTIWYQPQFSESWTIDTFDVLVQGTDRLEVSNVIPFMLTPGKPTDVVFVINNSGTAYVRNVLFTWSEKNNKILPLGSGNRKYIESIATKESAEVKFTLVADPSTTSGVYNINANIAYTIGSNISKSFDDNIGLFVGGSGEFDVGLQSSQSGSMSFSIANTGSNPATSVSVKIPDQADFIVTGPASSFVGNLNPGEFTMATFQITQRNMSFSDIPGNPRNFSGGRNASTAQGMPAAGSNGQVLKIDISYTDTNSNRQMVEKEIQIRPQDLTGQTVRSLGTQARTSGSGMDLVVFGIAGIVLIIVLIKYGGRIRSRIKRAKN